MKHDILEYFGISLFNQTIKCVDFKKLEVYLVGKSYDSEKIAQELNKIKRDYFYLSQQQGSQLDTGLSPTANHNSNLYCIKSEQIRYLKDYLSNVII